VDNLTPPDPNAQEIPAPLPSILPTPPSRNPVLFNDRGLRAGWRLLIYFLLIAASFASIGFIARRVHTPTGGIPSPSAALFQEGLAFAVVFGCALIMSGIERRSPGEYGLPIPEAFGRKFWLGMLLGLVEISLLIGLISAFGGYSFGSIALSSKGIVGWGLLHLVLFTVVGFFEEFMFRGYTQFTLADGIGFWPAALVLSLGFGAVHLGNPGEGPVGAASVALVGIFFAFTLQRTGDLWYAVGLHASFDWGETYLFSVPNQRQFYGRPPFQFHPPRREVANHGTVGPCRRVFCFLTMGLQFLIVVVLSLKTKLRLVAAASCGRLFKKALSHSWLGSSS
jgi:membrane protease YdiL (CAAX protease family)